MPADLHFLTIAAASQLIRARKLSPLEYAEALLARIAALDPQLNAFITVTAELARAQARAAEAEIMAGRYRGPLHGIPFALKDIYNTRGILTSGGSRSLHRQYSDARCHYHAHACTKPARYCSANCKRMNSRTADRRSICRGRRRAIRGTSNISPAARRAARARRSRPA